MKKFPSKNLMNSSRTSFYNQGSVEESNAEKFLLMEINQKISGSPIPEFSKERLFKLIRFLLNGDLKPEDPKFVDLKRITSSKLIHMGSLSFKNEHFVESL
jgi:hypothetical protein